MGFTPTPTLYHLEFDDEFQGLEVTMFAPSVGTLLEARSLLESGEDGLPRAWAAFLDHVESWNLELPERDGGGPAAVSLTDLHRFEPSFVNRLVLTWVRGRAEVPAPLGERSDAGPRPPAVPIPMEPLSPSLAS